MRAAPAAGGLAADAPSALEPWLELDGKQLPIHPVDPEGNACRKRPPRRPEPPLPDDESSSVDFDPRLVKLGRTKLDPEAVLDLAKRLGIEV